MTRTAWFAVGVVVVLVGRGCADARARYAYGRGIGSYWNLSVKASTLTMKADYLNQFVAAIDSARLTGHNALFFLTPDNDVALNVVTLKNLQHRMEEIRGMDVTSFAYQQAIAQISAAQEQDEATHILGVIKGAWYLEYHPFLWDWVNVMLYLLLGSGLVCAFVVLVDE